MTDDNLIQPRAGWYDDPETPGRARYWDGYSWHGKPHKGVKTRGPLPPPMPHAEYQIRQDAGSDVLGPQPNDDIARAMADLVRPHETTRERFVVETAGFNAPATAKRRRGRLWVTDLSLIIAVGKPNGLRENTLERLESADLLDVIETEDEMRGVTGAVTRNNMEKWGRLYRKDDRLPAILLRTRKGDVTLVWSQRERATVRRAFLTISEDLGLLRSEELVAAAVLDGAPQAMSSQPVADPVKQLQDLADLHAAGSLTDEEFALAKSRILRG